MLSASPRVSAAASGGMATFSQIINEYIEYLLPADRSMKVLLVDEATIHIVATSFSQTALLRRGVYLVDKIGASRQRREFKSMRCIIFIRPDTVSVDAACREIEIGKYSSYTIAFCGATCPEHLDRLALVDKQCLVNRVEEVFCDFCALSKNVFTVAASPPLELTSLYVSNAQVHRLAESLAAMSVAQRRRPLIRVQQSSSLARRVAAELVAIYRRDPELYDYRHKEAVLLIVDRSADPVTPLLTPWTYQAMLHEHIGLTYNTLQLPSGAAGADDEGYVFSAQDDAFFAANMCSNWGDLCSNVKSYLDKCKTALSLDRNTATMEEVKNYIQKIPETKNLAGSVMKHATVSNYLSKVIKDRHLLQVALLEQSMVASNEAQDHWRQLQELAAQHDIQANDILRLCIIYNLHYERSGQASRTESILDRISSTQTGLLRKVRAYYGSDTPTEPLFADTGVMATIAKNFMSTGNVYTQHEPVLKRTLQQVFSGRLDTSMYPYQGSEPSFSPPIAEFFQPKDVVVFMCGGFTFAEAALVHGINHNTLYKPAESSNFAAGGVHAAIGGDCVLNAAMFLSRLART